MKRLLLVLSVVLIFTSCASSRQVSIFCEPQHAAIYVDGQYQGKGVVVKYQIPPKQKYIVVSCSEDGVSFVERRFYTKSIPSVLNIYLDEYKTYSSNPQTFSTH